MIKELIKRNRSFRRFDSSYTISESTLRELIDLGRISASAANLQPLKYIISCTTADNDKIFPQLAWAGYLKNWPCPQKNERPAAYIIILNDTTIAKSPGCDHGIAAQSILLGAAQQGIGGCMIGSINRKKLTAELNIPDHLDILLVIALGKPCEKIVLEDITQTGSIEYYRDENDVHHVPKRTLDEIIISR